MQALEAAEREFFVRRKTRAGAMLHNAIQNAERQGALLPDELQTFVDTWRALDVQLEQALRRDWQVLKDKERLVQSQLEATKAAYLKDLAQKKVYVAEAELRHLNRMIQLRQETKEALEVSSKRYKLDPASSPQEQLALLFAVQEKLCELHNDLLTSRVTCCVCLDTPRSVLLVPCNHFAVCNACFEQLNSTCPICRAHIEGNRVIHF